MRRAAWPRAPVSSRPTFASATSSASSAAGRVAGVSRAEPVLAFRPRSVASSTAWAREPRFIALGVGRHAPRPQQALDEPAHAAGGERLELPRALGAPRGELRQHGRADRRGQPRRLGLRARRRLRAPQLARGRRLARRPRHLGQQPAPALRPQLVGEQRPHVVEERRGDQRLALLVGRAPGQEQHLLRARDAGVEQRALAVEHVLVQRQPQPRRRGQPAPRVVVEERLGHRPLRELGVLEPAHEDGAEAPRADLERVGEQHALGRVALAHLDRRRASPARPSGPPSSAGSVAASPRSSPAAARSSAATRASSRSSGSSTSARRTCGAAHSASASATSAARNASAPSRRGVGEHVERAPPPAAPSAPRPRGRR